MHFVWEGEGGVSVNLQGLEPGSGDQGTRQILHDLVLKVLVFKESSA
jgi:hypothetical protein